MRTLLWILALFALAVGLSLALRVNDGYVLLVLPPYRGEVSFNLALLALLLGFAAFYAFLRAAALTLSLPRRVREFRARRQADKAATDFSESVRLFCLGEWRSAIGRAAQVRDDDRWGALAAALAARAAGELGAVEEQREWLARAAERDPRLARAAEATGEVPPGDIAGP